MYYRQQLGLYFKPSFHPSIHPSIRLPFFCPSIISSSVLPAIYQNIDKSAMKGLCRPLLLFILPHLHPSIPSSSCSSPCLFHSYSTAQLMCITSQSFTPLSSLHTWNAPCSCTAACARPLFICHIVHIGSCFPADTHWSTRSKLFLSSYIHISVHRFQSWFSKNPSETLFYLLNVVTSKNWD